MTTPANSGETLYRLQIELANGDSETFGGQSAADVTECMRRFLHRDGPGLTFHTPDGKFPSWTWDEIRGVGALRMVADTEIETASRVRRWAEVVEP